MPSIRKKYLLLFFTIAMVLFSFLYIQKYEAPLWSKEKLTELFVTSSSDLTDPNKNTHTITLTDAGFVPENLVIRVGDTVIFTTDTDNPFWPASSLHPTHELYPEFDPKGPIVPGNEWGFRFDNVGSWTYHDHIASHYTGVIHVLALGEKKIPTTVIFDEDCTLLKGYKKTQCWDTQLREAVLTKGADAGFEYLIAIYNAEPEVAKNCHEWVHILGEAGYEIFAKGGVFQLRPETAWCSYGYFHGFINAMIADTGNLEQAVDFCNMAVAQLADEQSAVESNCLHGIGHVGIDLLFEEPEYWGNFQKTADAGYALCGKLFGNNKYLTECYVGVIHDLRLNMRNQSNGMSYEDKLEKKDPYYFCRNQKEEYQMACYSDFASMFWEIFDGDIKAALTYIVKENISDRRVTERSITKATTAWVEYNLAKNEHKESVEACRALPIDFFSLCMYGIAVGFIQHGEPNNLHEKAFAFCRSEYLSNDERSLCFTQITQLLSFTYTQQQFSNVCNTLAITEKYDRCLR